MNWRTMVISQEDSIESALSQLNLLGSQFLAVCDTDYKLVGTITDGDIRRGLLSGVNLTYEIEKVMNREPKFKVSGESEDRFIELFNTYKIKYLPIVTSDMTLINIMSENDIGVNLRKENPVLLMVGGLGTRLRPLTNDLPKPLLPVGGVPILEHIVKHLKSQGFYKFIFAVNYKKEMIMDYFGDGTKLNVEIRYLKEEKRMGTAGPLSLIEEELEEDMIVMNGDLITNMDFRDLLNHHECSAATMTVAVRAFDFQIPYGVVNIKDNQLISIEEKPIRTSYVSAGIYVLNPKSVKKVPKDSFFDMPELIQCLIDQGEMIRTYKMDSPWLDIGRKEDYEKVQRKPEEFIIYDSR